MPSCLHDWLGIANHLLHELGETWAEIVEAWVKHAKVSAVGYWQGHFLGNQLRDLFEDISFLEDGHGNAKIPLMAPYIMAIKSFDSVREGCFGMTLCDDYEVRICRFQADYNVLVNDFGMSTIVKAHDIFFHVIDWLDRWQIPLGLVSEQAGEAIHSRFIRFVDNKQCSSPDSPDFGKNLKKVTSAWTSHAAVTYE